MSDATKMTTLEWVERVTEIVDALSKAVSNQPHDLVLDALLTLYLSVAVTCPGCAASAASVLPLIARDLHAIAAAARAEGAGGTSSHAIH